MVNPNLPLETRTFLLLGTGQECEVNPNSDQLIYVGTLEGFKGSLFVHVFEKTKYFHNPPLER